MKIHFIPVLGMALALTPYASPQQQSQEQPITPLDGANLAQFEAAFEFCAKSDTKSGSIFKEGLTLLSRMHPDSPGDDTRKSKDFQDGLKETRSDFEKLSSKDALATCEALLGKQ